MPIPDYFKPEAILPLLAHTAALAGSTIQVLDQDGHVALAIDERTSSDGDQSRGGLGQAPPPATPEGAPVVARNGAAVQTRDVTEPSTPDQAVMLAGATVEVEFSVGGDAVGSISASGGEARRAATLAAGIVEAHLASGYELGSLSAELLAKYEELTLLYDLGQALGAVFATDDIAAIAVDHAWLCRQDKGIGQQTDQRQLAEVGHHQGQG